MDYKGNVGGCRIEWMKVLFLFYLEMTIANSFGVFNCFS